jgi:ABC-2 type transport system ATP-binding protein
MATHAVEVQHVSKRFRLSKEKYTSLKERVIHAGRVPHEDLWALRDVDFEVNEGETVGILGRNGSGKSTLLKTVCGVLQPTDGQVVVRGKLAGLLELGAGFQQELSGRDNIYLNGSMLGMSRREVDRVFDAIVEFAELDQFIDNQVKFYSSGMYIRLGFAVAVNVDPDILVIDEVLAVGDERFQRKCMERIKSFQEEGRTILFVSHSPDQVRSICDRAVVLSDGEMIGYTTPGEAVRLFRERLLEAQDILSLATPAPPPPATDAPGLAFGGMPGATAAPTVPAVPPTEDSVAKRPVRIDEVRVQYPGVNERPYLLTGQALAIQIGFDTLKATNGVVFSFEVRDSEDNTIIRNDTDILGHHYDLERGPGMVEFLMESFPMLDGVYRVVAGIQSRLGGMMFDWREPAAEFEVMNPGRATGALAVPLSVRILHGGAESPVTAGLVPPAEPQLTSAAPHGLGGPGPGMPS